ncbi:MAG TPA: PilT/PilU family type 4a pilus ATPase [Kofleriaceae bacterium]|nr:PilT/PilU family type 4a pilus ATPase [Kofleriaceae bacterium]
MSQILDRVLSAARQLGASDVHLKAGLPPIFRIKGDLRTIREVKILSRELLAEFAEHMMNDRQRADFEQHLDLDLAYSTADGERYRVSLFQQRGSVGMVLRLIPPDVPPLDRLNLPQAVLDLTGHPRGLILVTGAAGSGKSTTLAAMLDHINTQRACHIITVEDPIEYALRDKRSVLSQRELGFDTMSFSRALRAALRQDPDVILVSELRDRETAELALTAAELGHLVLSSLPAVDVCDTVTRVVELFPVHQQLQARRTLASVLRGVISQQLLPRADGAGMVPALEVLVNDDRIRELIEDPSRASELRAAVAEDLQPRGMMTFDRSLANLVKQRLVTYEAAVAHTTRPSDFALQFRGASASPHPGWANGHVALAANPGAGHDEIENKTSGK